MQEKPHNDTDHEVNLISGWKLALLYPPYLLMRLWLCTLRLKIDDDTRKQLQADTPRIILIWHNQLFLAAGLHQRYRRHRPTHGLISASKDGAWLAAFYRLMGMNYIRGSSSNKGARALVTCLRALREGSDIAITPDGPRGPRYSMKPGPAYLARKANSPLCLGGIRFTRVKRFKSWDGFFLPLPFSTVYILSKTYPNMDAVRECYPEHDNDADALQEALRAINTACDKRYGQG